MSARHAWLGLLLWSVSASALNRGLGEPPEDIDRQTPLATVEGFLNTAHAGRYADAAQYLWLDHLALPQQAVQGPRLARRLRFVLDHQNWLDLSRISKNPDGEPEHHNSDELGVITLHKIKEPVRLVRVHSGTDDVWVFDRETVRAIDDLFAQYGPPFGDRMPELLTAGTLLDMEIWQWLGLILLVVGSVILGRVGESLGLALAHSFTKLTRVQEDDELVEAGRNSLRLPIIAGLLVLGSSFLLLPARIQDAVDLIARSLAIVALAWFSVRFVNKGADLIERRLNAGQTDDPYRSRGLETQITVLRRLLVVAAYVVAGALLLLQFQAVRSLGLSLLASAGVAGLVIGFAAQKSLSTVLAGIQISLSQPIRIGDKVLVEAEYGTIEEIRLTYVVVLLWDLRRMVLPITYFLEKPFQNWSKNGTQLLGSVMLQVDYLADVNAFRTEVQRILKDEAQAWWDGAVWGVQVVETTERTQTLRVLVSARDAAVAFDLRCILRESLVRFLRANPEWIPQQRTLPVEASVEKLADVPAISASAKQPAATSAR